MACHLQFDLSLTLRTLEVPSLVRSCIQKVIHLLHIFQSIFYVFFKVTKTDNSIPGKCLINKLKTNLVQSQLSDLMMFHEKYL